MAVALLFIKIKRDFRDDDDNNDDDDGYGGIDDIEPDLDLPPGITLPVDGPKSKEPVLV